jgi:hypothetical protein
MQDPQQGRLMKSSSKYFLKLLLPPIFFEIRAILKRIIIDRGNRVVLRNNYRLKNFNEKDNAVFIANGPSLKRLNIEDIEGHDMIVCNDFYLHKSFKHLNIKFYINLDPTVKWIQNIKHLISQGDFEDITLVLTSRVRLEIETDEVFKRTKVFYVSPYGETKVLNRFFIDITKPIIHIRNITQFIMIFTNYIGYKNVFFIGVDMNHLSYKTKSDHPHFYSNKENVSLVPDIQEGEYSRNALSLSILFNSIKELNKITKTNFFNANKESYLEHIDFKDIL